MKYKKKTRSEAMRGNKHASKNPAEKKARVIVRINKLLREL